MNVREFVDSLRTDPRTRSSIAHVELLPARAARFAPLKDRLADPLPAVLAARGLEQLYVHQVQTIEHVRAGRDVVVVTGTASGKTLCYNLPVMETCLKEPDSTALYLFPTKALCQDQLGVLQSFLQADAQLAAQVRPAIYDGDTPTTNRRRIKSQASVVLTNPDMVHVGILSYHAQWSRFFAQLRHIVIDEVHTYRGIFGANVAGVLRRLLRVCRHYGAEPRFICASATVANPGELVERLIGRPVSVVADDGAPRGEKALVLCNPPYLDRDHLSRRSASDEAVQLMVNLVRSGAQAICFTRTRQSAELIYRYVEDRLRRLEPAAAGQVRAYRGGYLPNERRAIEQQLFEGQLKGVISTNALELGIDVGSLDASVLVGYPGTIASTWQQAGRAGRRSEGSLAVLIAQNDPIDQYLVRQPQYLLGLSPESAVVDPENPYVLQNHLKAAAFELPLSESDSELFGPVTLPIAETLRDGEQLNEVAGRFYSTSPQSPSQEFSLRHMSNNTFAIIERVAAPAVRQQVQNGFRSPAPDITPASASPNRWSPPVPAGYRVIANVDAISAPELVYPEAVYLHDGDTYLVRKLDLEGKLAYVERMETDYYTQAILESHVRIQAERDSHPVGAGPEAVQGLGGSEEFGPAGFALEADDSRARFSFGDLEVSWKTVAFKKIKFETRENLGMGPVDLPAQTLPTTGFWLVLSPEIERLAKSHGLRPAEGMVGIRNLMIQALPLVAMCDPRDVSGSVNSSNLGSTTVFVYDRYPGGLGYSEKGFAQSSRLVEICYSMVDGCGCLDGCPSCVGLPNLRPAIHSDPDLTRGYPIPNKEAARFLLGRLVDQPASTQCRA